MFSIFVSLLCSKLYSILLAILFLIMFYITIGLLFINVEPFMGQRAIH